MRRAAKVDANQAQIVQQLRRCGYTVLPTHQLKNAFDVLVGAHGLNFAFEIKDPAKPPSARKLTPGEQAFQEKWRGQVATVTTLEECLEVINKHRKEC
jgi:hypothetical protein